MKSFLKPFLVISLLLCLYTFISAISYVYAVSDDIANSVFRLHVIANSDSKEDQELKLKVRDELLKFMNELSKDCSSKQEVMQVASMHQADLQKIAKNVIEANGFNYTVSIEVGIANFPTKQYGDITLPSGTYDALKVKIGEAKRSKLVVCHVSSSLLCGCKYWHCS